MRSRSSRLHNIWCAVLTTCDALGFDRDCCTRRPLDESGKTHRGEGARMKRDCRKEHAALLGPHLLRSSGIVASCLIMACVASVRTAAAQQSLPIEQASRGEQPIFSESGLATWYGG